MTTQVPATLVAAGQAVASLGFTPANKAGDTFAGAIHTTPVVLTFSATAMVLNCALANVFSLAMTANVTVAMTFTNLKDGQTIQLFISQDATGSRTMTWPASFKWAAATPVALSTAANAVDMLTATYRAATGFWYVSLAKAFG